MSAPRVLVVDDDPGIIQVVRFALDKGGFRVASAADGLEAIARIESWRPDLVVLDINMPEIDGLEVCRRVRRTSSLPIVFLSSSDEEVDRILGLELGGDDYVTKPFSPRELVARVRAVLRRSAAPSQPVAGTSPTMEHRGLTVDLERCEARYRDERIILTATELNLLATLVRRPGKVFRRDELMDGAYSDGTVVSDRTIDSHIRRVRRKFAPVGIDPIETVHGIGYRASETFE